MMKRALLIFAIACSPRPEPEQPPPAPAAAIDAAAAAAPPPAPAPAPAPAPEAPAKKLRAAILKFEEVGMRIEVTLGRGSDDGVAQSWRGIFVDARGYPLGGGAQCIVLRVAAKTTVCLSELGLDQLAKLTELELEPR